MRRLASVVLVIATGCARPAPPEPAAPVATPTPGSVTKLREPKRSMVRIAAVGDVLLHDGVQEGARDHANEINCGGFDHLYEQVSQYLADADLTFANLETPVTERAPRGHGRWLFNSPIPAVRALKRAGVDIVSVANNHAMDQGHKGFVETLARLDEIGLVAAGAATSPVPEPVIVEVDGLKIAFLAWTQFVNEPGNDVKNGAPRVQVLDEKVALRAVASAAKTADAVIVSMHWGVEYKNAPRKQEKTLAHRFVDAGATAVIGHHPHVLQPIERVRTKDGRDAVIFYSLGNFISNQGARLADQQSRRDGALVRFELVRTDYGGGLKTKVTLGSVDALPLWTENNHLELAANGGPRYETIEAIDLKRDIHVVALDRALANVRREMAKIPRPVPEPYAGSWKALQSDEALYRKRKDQITTVLGAEFIRSLETTTASR